jgi:hypothetical protein
MNTAVLPSLSRLGSALENASRTTRQISRIIKQAEDESAALFRISGDGDRSRAGGGPASLPDLVTGMAGGGAANTTASMKASPSSDCGWNVFCHIGNAIRSIGEWLSGGGSSPPAPAPLPPNTVTEADATRIFNDMKDESDIAFNYPIDGCYARAHIMNDRIAARYGVTPNKVWAFGDLNVATTGPYGNVNWWYHVAPVVNVQRADGTVQPMVIDPSIAPGPITIDRWKQIMQAPGANTQITQPGRPPTNPATGTPYGGTGYWPGDDPSHAGGVNGHATDLMRKYKDRGNRGVR